MGFRDYGIESLEYSDVTNWTLSRPLRVGVVPDGNQRAVDESSLRREVRRTRAERCAAGR